MNFVNYSILLFFLFFSLNASAQKRNLKTDTIKVYGECEQCKERIEGTLSRLGTYDANWDIDSKILIVSFDSLKLTRLKIEQKMAAIGHDTKSFQADLKTYAKLPDCCKYERFKKTEQTGIEVPPIKKDSLEEKKTSLKGAIFEEREEGILVPLYGALVRVINTNNAIYTDSLGVFQLFTSMPATLAISYLGYVTDTVHVYSYNEIEAVFKKSSSITLREVVVGGNPNTSYVSSLSTLNTLNISSKELSKAACCNLSESFETSPSIDISYSDAVTGIRQIQLLGLSGNYTQITTENIPEIRGLAGSFGLTFIPGPWIEAIQVTKGIGSVVNGYESIAGQINIEEKKPDDTETLLMNGYSNNMGRLEASIIVAKKLNHQWSTSFLTNTNGVFAKRDDNKDGFLDIPLGRHFNVQNRWKFENERGLVAQFSIKALADNREAGEVGFDPLKDKLTSQKYGVGMNVGQYAFAGKVGYSFPQEKYKNIGLVFSAINFNNNSFYGLHNYNTEQNSIHANLIYQSILGTTVHKYRTGLSFVGDRFNENFDSTNFRRQEIVPGAFFEYTYSPIIKFTAIAGFRIDYHNFYGVITTPRIHLKYDFTTSTILRISAGSGFRVANILAENTGLFVSSRQYSILHTTSSYAYGLNPERAWNYGLNFTHQFKLNNHPGSLAFDAYQTVFREQVVIDIDANPQQILFYNLQGSSYSNSIQAELNYELINQLSLRMAYRWLDVQTNYSGAMLRKPLVAKHRAFINMAYETLGQWTFDLTTQWISSKRLPNSGTNPVEYQFGTFSPHYIQMSGQVSKRIKEKWDFYLGIENITNYTQQLLIISANQPFSSYFDSSITWGPVNGRVVYLGLKFKIQ